MMRSFLFQVIIMGNKLSYKIVKLINLILKVHLNLVFSYPVLDIAV